MRLRKPSRHEQWRIMANNTKAARNFLVINCIQLSRKIPVFIFFKHPQVFICGCLLFVLTSTSFSINRMADQKNLFCGRQQYFVNHVHYTVRSLYCSFDCCTVNGNFSIFHGKRNIVSIYHTQCLSIRQVF